MPFSKKTLLLSTLITGLLLVLTSGGVFAAGSGSSELADAGLELRVKAALLTKIGWDMLDIDVEATGGHVWLKGEAANRSHQELATEVARSVQGVDQVDNQLTLEKSDGESESETPVADKVSQGMTHAEAEVRDAILESRVKTALIDSIGFEAFEIEVEATDGEVSLRGDLEDERHKQLALDVTRKCKGVDEVIDLIRVS